MASPTDILRSTLERISRNLNAPKPLKESFLALRLAAETAYAVEEAEHEVDT